MRWYFQSPVLLKKSIPLELSLSFCNLGVITIHLKWSLWRINELTHLKILEQCLPYSTCLIMISHYHLEQVTHLPTSGPLHRLQAQFSCPLRLCSVCVYQYFKCQIFRDNFPSLPRLGYIFSICFMLFLHGFLKLLICEA